MQSAKYLYNEDMKQYAELPYKDVLLIKVNLATKLMRKLVITDNMIDNTRMSEVSKAITFNRELLKELGYEDTDIALALKTLNQTGE